MLSRLWNNDQPSISSQNDDETYRQLRRNIISESSRRSYNNSSARFMTFMCETKPEKVHQPWLDIIQQRGNTTEIHRELFQNTSRPDLIPLKFNLISDRDFVEWADTLTNKDGGPLGKSALAAHRSAFLNMFRDYDQNMSERNKTLMSEVLKGMERKRRRQLGIDGGRLKTGKDPLSFEAYSYLCGVITRRPEPQGTFAKCFLTICWNLMARSQNALSIHINHVEWVEDSLGIYYAHQKNDQAGDRPDEARHVYANPKNPQICPILALGIYWMVYEFPIVNGELLDGNLFPGDKQYSRFTKYLSKLMHEESLQRDFRDLGIDVDSIGTHSLRKGASTFCTSGTTACPSVTAVHLRAGWSLGGVQDRYLRYEAAGDQYVGRTVTGLPSGSEDFALLPPRFIDRAVGSRAVDEYLPLLPQHLRHAGQYVLASVIYHRDWLRNNLDPRHRLLRSPLFMGTDLLDSLGTRIVCDLESPDSNIKATGIPPHVMIFSRIAHMEKEVQSLKSAVDENPEKTRSLLMHDFDERAIGAGTVTRHGLREMLDDVLQTRIDPLLRLPIGTNSINGGTSNLHNTRSLNDMLVRSVNFSLPDSFRLVSGTPLLAFHHWCCPDESAGVPALRVLSPTHIINKKTRKRFHELNWLMMKLENSAKEKGIWDENPTAEHVNIMYGCCSDVIAVPERTGTGRKRRTGQLTWHRTMELVKEKEKALMSAM